MRSRFLFSEGFLCSLLVASLSVSCAFVPILSRTPKSALNPPVLEPLLYSSSCQLETALYSRNGLSGTAERLESRELETSRIVQAVELPASIAEDVIPMLSAWAREGNAEAAEQAQNILDRLLRQEGMQLSAKHFTIVMDAWGRAGRPEKAEQVFVQLMTAHQTYGVASLAPNRITWNVLLLAHVRNGNIGRAEEWLAQMEQKADNDYRLRPRTGEFNLLLSAYAHNGDTQTAEQTIKSMVGRCIEAERTGECLCRPNTKSYNFLLEAYSKSGKPGSGQRAEDILVALQNEREGPDARTFAAVVQTLWRDSSVPDAVAQARAEELYQQATTKGMINYMDKLQSFVLDTFVGQKGSAVCDPFKAEKLLSAMEETGSANLVAYNKVLKAWKLSGESDSAKRAENLLQRMEKRNLVDRISYTTVIGALATKGDRASANRANQILDSMIQRYHDSGKVCYRPNTQTLNTVILALSRSRNPSQAEHILDKMEKYLAAGFLDMAPTVVSYSTVMDGWAKYRGHGAVDGCEKVFLRMQKMFDAGHKEAKPNLVSYVTLINAYANARDEHSAEKAQNLLFQMYEAYKGGDIALKPNTQTISAVIEAWQKSGRRDAGEHAEALLDWMISVYSDHQDETLRPNEYSFSSAISAWSKSRKLGKAIRARKVLDRMSEMNICPNTHCYTAVISSCAYCENDYLDKQDALKIAVQTYKDLAASKKANANHVTFATTITALRNLMPQGERRDAAVQTIFKNAAADGYVDEMVVQRIQSVLSPNKLRGIFAAAVTDDGVIRVERLPNEWRRKVKSAPARKKKIPLY